MELKQKKYKFSSKKGDLYVFPFDAVVIVNDAATNIKAVDLFSEISDISGYVVKGYSILENLNQDASGLLTELDIENKTIKISFKNTTTGEEFVVKEIYDPVFILDEIDISEEEKERIISLITSNLLAPVEPSRVDEPTGSSTVPEEEVQVEIVPEPESYVEARDEMLKDGFSEEKIENYRIFTKDGESPALVIIKHGDFDEIDLQPTSKKGVYMGKADDGQSLQLTDTGEEIELEEL